MALRPHRSISSSTIGAEVLQEVDAAPVEQLDVRLEQPAGRVEALVLGREHMRVGRLLERDDLGEPRLHRFDLGGAEMLAHQDGEAGQQLRAHRLAHQRVIMSPVEHALRIELGVIRVADVEDVFPRDQHVVEYHGGVELVALRRERMLDRVGLDQALAADDGDALAGSPGRRRR